MSGQAQILFVDFQITSLHLISKSMESGVSDLAMGRFLLKLYYPSYPSEMFHTFFRATNHYLCQVQFPLE